MRYGALPLFMAVCLTPVGMQANDLTTGFTVVQNQYRSGTLGGVGEFTVSTSLGSGFVNVWDSTGSVPGWLVRNLPVNPAISGAPNISAHMDLGVSDGTKLSTTSLFVDFSTTVNQNGTVPAGDTLQSGLSVGSAPFAIGGVDNLAPIESTLIKPVLGFSFLNGLFGLDYQFGHPNVQAATNQCAPAAVANSLAWLASAYPKNVFVPNPNTPGLKGDNTLVGKLDTAMNRDITCGNATLPARQHGCGVWPLDGKLGYLAANGLGGLVVSHQTGTGVDGSQGQASSNAPPPDPLPGTDITRHGVTSHGNGNASFAFIQKEIQAGEDVEIDVSWNCGTIAAPKFCRHYVNVTGAGTIGGIPFITHQSDYAQTDVDPMDKLGTDRIDFDFVTGGNNLPLWGGGAVIDQVITESVPEPAVLALVGAGLLLVGAFRRPRFR